MSKRSFDTYGIGWNYSTLINLAKANIQRDNSMDLGDVVDA